MSTQLFEVRQNFVEKRHPRLPGGCLKALEANHYVESQVVSIDPTVDLVQRTDSKLQNCLRRPSHLEVADLF